MHDEGNKAQKIRQYPNGVVVIFDVLWWLNFPLC